MRAIAKQSKNFFSLFPFNFSSNFGFSLAEVLIALLVIGVVSAITIPILMSNLQQNQNIEALKKQYSVLSSALSSIASENGGDLAYVFGSDTSHASVNNFRDLILEKIKYDKKCDADGYYINSWSAAEHCWPRTVVDLNGVTPEAYWGPWGNFSSAILSDGTLISFNLQWPNCVCTANCPAADYCGRMFFDVNGYKKPNVYGKDVFQLQVYKKGKVLPFKNPSVTNPCSSADSGEACSWKYILGY